jgi:tripartite-type tricarboxylate transporter receptor subunit TctC
VPKTIRLIVPFPPGGGADLLVRLAEHVGRTAGVTTVVENRPGAASAPNMSHVQLPMAARY